MKDFIQNLIVSISHFSGSHPLIEIGVNIALVMCIAFLSYYFIRIFLGSLVKLASRTTWAKFEAPVAKYKVISKLAQLGSLLCLIATMKILNNSDAVGDDFLLIGIQLYSVVVFLRIAISILNVLGDAYKRLPIARDVPIKGGIQITKLVFVLIALILTVSVLTDKSPVYLISSLGAIGAVVVLVFRDTILGFVGGIQIIANRLIAVGDWVEIPSFEADGEVLEIGLNTIIIQNWDKTISNVPTHSVMSVSFKNWRGMSQSGGRRIKRAIHIDQNTVKRISNNEQQILVEKFPLLEGKLEGVTKTNISLFRCYIEQWLKQRKDIQQNMTLLVRELAPSDKGLPIEIYCFSNDKQWRNYEVIQANIIDELLVTLHEFNLRHFQSASGHDLAELSKSLHH